MPLVLGAVSQLVGVGLSDQQMRQTPRSSSSHILSKRHGLSVFMAQSRRGSVDAQAQGVGNHVFDDPVSPRSRLPKAGLPQSPKSVPWFRGRHREVRL